MHERSHLQEWILANPKVLGPDVKIVASEFDRWQTATGAPVNDRLDIFGLDSEGRLVIVELKVDLAPYLLRMQAINYAAMASRLTPEDVAGLYATRETAKGRTTAPRLPGRSSRRGMCSLRSRSRILSEHIPSGVSCVRHVRGGLAQRTGR